MEKMEWKDVMHAVCVAYDGSLSRDNHCDISQLLRRTAAKVGEKFAERKKN